MSVSTNYEVIVTLLDRTQALRTPVNQSGSPSQQPIVNGDLSQWFLRLEYENTGIQRINNAKITFRMDTFGTFFRNNPVLFDQFAKSSYLIEFFIQQSINGVTYTTKTFRGEVGEPQIQEDKEVGEVITVPLRDIAYASKETPISAQDIFETPHDRFFNVVSFYPISSLGPVSPPAVAFSLVTNNLPNNPDLQQDWTPAEPTMMHDLMSEVIERAANPSVLGGVFTDYYFDFDPHSLNTLRVNVTADVFGGSDSGVIISSDSIVSTNPAVLQEKTVLNDNTRYKNQVVLVCDSASGTLPMNTCVFSSYWEHGIVRPEWSSSDTYNYGDLVKRTNLSSSDPNQVIRFFKCLTNNLTSSTPPESDSNNWVEDFSTLRGASSFIDYTPWTSDLNAFKLNMAGLSNSISGYVGFCYDWNVTRANYDPNSRIDPTDQYAAISVKMVTRIDNSPPAGALLDELYHGMRIMVGTSPTGDFVGHSNQIAEWDAFTNGGMWHFSNSPTLSGSSGDIFINLDDATVRQWNGTSYIIIWGTDPSSHTDINYDFGMSPFHIASNIALVTGATGVDNSAVEFTYKWQDENSLIVPFDGDVKNRSSRGAWISFMFPYPRIQGNGHYSGDIYGGGGPLVHPVQPYLDSNNLNYTSKGNFGWNLGTESEDLGKITGIRFKLRLGIFSSQDDSALTSFQANIPMIFWSVDIFDRVWYQTFTLLRNNEWQLVSIPFGYNAPMQMYFARWDELPKFFGFELPWDFTLSQKEYTGVQFDWKYVKGWGVMMAQPYDLPSGFYTSAQDPGLNQLYQELQQAGATIWNNTGALIGTALTGAPLAVNFVVDHTKIAIDELCFQKELITVSNNTPLDFPRAVVQYAETQTDYLNAKTQSQGSATRLSFYPQFWHIRAKGDVRAQLGKLLTVEGSRVPTGSISLVTQTVKHIVDHTGYSIEALLVRKFVVPMIDSTPLTGVSGGLVFISGSNFAPLDNVSVYFNNSGTPSFQIPTDVKGFFVHSLSIPSISAGTYTVKAVDTQGNIAIYYLPVTA